MIDWFFFSISVDFFAVSSWKISSCFKPVQFWSNSSLVVDKTKHFPWLCILSLLLPPPLPPAYNVCYFAENLTVILCTLGCNCRLAFLLFLITLTCFAIVSLTPKLCDLHTAPWLEWDLTKLTLTHGVNQALKGFVPSPIHVLVLSRALFHYFANGISQQVIREWNEEQFSSIC